MFETFTFLKTKLVPNEPIQTPLVAAHTYIASKLAPQEDGFIQPDQVKSPAPNFK